MQMDSNEPEDPDDVSLYRRSIRSNADLTSQKDSVEVVLNQFES